LLRVKNVAPRAYPGSLDGLLQQIAANLSASVYRSDFLAFARNLSMFDPFKQEKA
jgi:hypothetical protein